MNPCLSDQLAGLLEKNGIIDHESRDIYAYGLSHAGMTILNIATTAVIGLLLGMLWQSMLFTITYIPLRIFAGGYHAKTRTRCYFASIGLLVSALVAIRCLQWTGSVCALVLAAAGIIIFAFSPAESVNKPLDEIERKVYRRRAIKVFLVESLGALCMIQMGFLRAGACIVTALGMLAAMVILGVIKKS